MSNTFCSVRFVEIFATLLATSLFFPSTALAVRPLADAVEGVIDGVVNIRTLDKETPEKLPTAKTPQALDGLFGYLTNPGNKLGAESNSQGSGFFVKNRKWIVTNYHVVKDSKNIVVATNRRKWATIPAELVAFDERTDIAVLRVRDGDDSKTVLKFGSSTRMRLGDTVFAIGNPFGYGHTVTTGILSAKGRVLGTGPFNDFLQTDAAMNPGNSGGPLFNTNGEVVGINTAIAPDGRGISFAIPSEIAAPVVNSIIQNGSFARPRLGAFVSDIAESGSINNQHYGIFINNVVHNSPAHKAGILNGDIILGVNGSPVREIPELQLALSKSTPGKEMILTVFRGKKTTAIKIFLGEFSVGSNPPMGSDEY